MENKEFEFRLKGMDILQSSISEININQSKTVNYNFDINIETKLNREKKMVFVAPTVVVRMNNKPKQLGMLKIALMFEFKLFDDYFDEKTNDFSLPKDINTTLISVSISTLRGVLFNQFKGTALHNAILPMIDPKGFVK